MNNGSKLLAVDVDDVLVHIATPWIVRAFERHPQLAMAAPQLAAWLREAPSEEVHETVTLRPQPHVQQWLLQEHKLPQALIPLVDLTYRGDPTFYDDLKPTEFCRGIMAALALPGRVAHIHAITHNFSNDDPCVASKERWLRKMLGGPERVTIHNVESGTKKSEIMHKFCPEPDSFADDAMKNVVDILLNDKVRPHEILIPRMGHNNLLPEVEHLAFLRKIQINYYENVL
jgi:hypothetical protein